MTAVAFLDTSTSPVATLYPDLAAELAVTRDILSRVPWEQAAYTVSYTHLTLPTNREV